MTLRLGLQGASGHAGSCVLSVLGEFPDISLVSALVSSQSMSLGEIVPGSELRFESDLAAAVSRSDIMLDFSTPTASLALARECAAQLKPVLIASTGHDSRGLAEITELAARIPILLAPNTSLGAFALKQLAIQARAMLGESYDIEIFELHHRRKRDAPSGTALGVAQALTTRFQLKEPRLRANAAAEREANEIGMASLRGGDVCGEHTVYLLGDGERLEISHRVTSRAIFARGALQLLPALMRMTPGMYAVADVLNR